ncbi:MAG: DUF1189 domain-containing protein [Lachnospiraceae bacterium]|nr:DUF1189 domain-containing protein [Lachnospiraceae bacterium]
MTTKINPFAQIYEAFKGFSFSDSFYNLRRQSTGSKILYSIIISILTSLVFCGLSAFKIASDKDLNQTLNDLPDFSYANGELYCAGQYDINQSGTYLLIDTNQNEFTENHMRSILNDSSTSQALMLSKTNMVMYRGTTGEYQNMTWNDFMGALGIQTFSKQMLLSGYRGVIYKVATVLFFIMIPYQFIKLFFITLLLTLVALICNATSHTDKDFPTLYWISFYIESVLLIIIAILKPLSVLRGSSLTIACIVLFAITMTNTLKHGEPAPAVSRPVSGGLNDDFDDFISRSDSSTVQSAFEEPKPSTYESSSNTYSQPDYQDPFAETSDTNTETEQKNDNSSSGLSLKLKD